MFFLVIIEKAALLIKLEYTANSKFRHRYTIYSPCIIEPYILFLEDVGEDIRHIHRYLTILKHSGVLDNAAGIVFGEWTELPAEMMYTSFIL